MAADAVNNAAVANDQGGLNWKVYSDSPIASATIAIQNQVTNQQAVDAISREALQSGIVLSREVLQGGIDFSRAVRAKATRMIFDTSGEQAAAFDREMAAGLENKLSNIEGLLAAGQQQEKTAITSPPQTGTGGAFGSDAGSALLQQIVNTQAATLSILEKIASNLPKT